jgi:hypothetical protein
MLTKENYETFFKMAKILQKAVKNAQQQHREMGIPNVYSKNGKIVWELPDGTWTTERPKGLE